MAAKANDLAALRKAVADTYEAYAQAAATLADAEAAAEDTAEPEPTSDAA